jgi:calcineurin-like phosphoesterase family protein
MTKTWFISDTHFGHVNITKFEDSDGQRIRPFNSIEEHDETIIANCNALIKPEDRLYVMGDVAMGRRHISTMGRVNGRKKLIKGNHDIFRLKDYTPYFEDILACRFYPELNFIFSHIPVHVSQLEHRFKRNFHGHLHSNIVMLDGKPDDRYINLCLEHTDFKPVCMDEIISKFK